jgi:hypothetical protein
MSPMQTNSEIDAIHRASEERGGLTLQGGASGQERAMQAVPQELMADGKRGGER